MKHVIAELSRLPGELQGIIWKDVFTLTVLPEIRKVKEGLLPFVEQELQCPFNVLIISLGGESARLANQLATSCPGQRLLRSRQQLRSTPRNVYDASLSSVNLAYAFSRQILPLPYTCSTVVMDGAFLLSTKTQLRHTFKARYKARLNVITCAPDPALGYGLPWDILAVHREQPLCYKNMVWCWWACQLFETFSFFEHALENTEFLMIDLRRQRAFYHSL